MGQWIYLQYQRSIQFQLGVFVIIVTPARIAQYSYDKARLLAATPFGWLVLGLIIGKSQSLNLFSLSLSNQCAHLFRLSLVTPLLSRCLALRMAYKASS